MHECSDCVFVANLDSLFIGFEDRKKATARPKFFGIFTMTNWVGHANFYIFKCSLCEEVSVDYPHGYTRGGFIYLLCNKCNGQLVLDSPSYNYIYESEGMPRLLTFWQRWKQARHIAERLEKLEPLSQDALYDKHETKSLN